MPRKAIFDPVEKRIARTILHQLDTLPYGVAPHIQEMRVHPDCGRIDLMLLPEEPGAPRLVLIEAKRHNAPDAAAKVIGQVLMYYAGALEIGQVGLGRLQAYARHTAGQPPRGMVSAQEVCREPGARQRPSLADAWAELHLGDKLQPQDVHLYIALDDLPVPSALLLLDRPYAKGIKIGVIHADVKRARMSVRRPSQADGWKHLRAASDRRYPRRGWRELA